ncbi:unnamed protein product [Rotaria socialis]|uniref:Uncharacterized protein n=3 Tax=Rotaria socialis TaxID=392032 RepID=A0A818BQA1_9BILA|nr:unnamed protein product [Rotaria socialis]
MSPTCMIKPKQSMHQQKSKSKSLKHKLNQDIEESIMVTRKKHENEEYLYVELDTKCSCLQSKFLCDSSIQFSRRYLQCQSSMPIVILRSYIQQILPHSSMTQISFYDSNNCLLKDSDILSSLKRTMTSTTHIPIRFTLLNRVTSLGHCLCTSSIEDINSSVSCQPIVIKRETIDKTLSTCSLISTECFSPCLSSSSPNESSNSISIVNLLTPPSSHSSFLIENIVHAKNIDNQSIIDEITSQFGEICPPLPKKKRNRLSKKLISSYSSSLPLDLSVKKRPSSFDFFSSQAKWVKT